MSCYVAQALLKLITLLPQPLQSCVYRCEPLNSVPFPLSKALYAELAWSICSAHPGKCQFSPRSLLCRKLPQLPCVSHHWSLRADPINSRVNFRNVLFRWEIHDLILQEVVCHILVNPTLYPFFKAQTYLGPIAYAGSTSCVVKVYWPGQPLVLDLYIGFLVSWSQLHPHHASSPVNSLASSLQNLLALGLQPWFPWSIKSYCGSSDWAKAPPSPHGPYLPTLGSSETWTPHSYWHLL